MNFLRILSLLILSIAAVHCGAGANESQIFAENKSAQSSDFSQKELCDLYAGSWQATEDGRVVDVLTIQGEVDPGLQICQFTLESSQDHSKLLLTMDGKATENQAIDGTPISLSSSWSDEKSLINPGDEKLEFAQNILLTLSTSGVAEGVGYTKSFNVLFSNENKESLKMETVLETERTVAGETETLPPEKSARSYVRVVPKG